MALANSKRGQLGFEVAGESYVLSFTTNALCAIEDEFQLKDISEISDVLEDNPSMRMIRTLFRLGLTDCQPSITDQEVGPLMDAIGGLGPSLQLLMLAIENAFPEAAKPGTANPPKAAAARANRGTGARSTKVGAKSGATPNNSGG